jgi:methionyl-tRNA formyltransferase
MLARRSIAIGAEETAPELSARLAQIGADLLGETLPRVERGEIVPEPQVDNQASYAPMLKRESGAIDWTLSARELANRVRAFQPWPGTYTSFRGGRLIIWRGRESNASAFDIEPGTILNIDDSGITIMCSGSTALLIQEVQVEGKRRVSAREFANGARLETGERINQD